jgi:hypothetical protein
MQPPDQRNVDADVEMTDADEQQQQEAAAAAAEASAPPAWADLPEGLLWRVAACLGSAVGAVMPMYTTCRCGPMHAVQDGERPTCNSTSLFEA